ncbi:hypothetical protein P4S72_03560 [Vibrio sp. PP-XX7]
MRRRDWQVTLAGVDVSDAQITLLDDRTANQTVLSDVNLSIAQFLPDKWTALSVSVSGKR